MIPITSVLEFVALKHGDHLDKAGEPYVWHLIRVSLALKQAGFGETAQIAALLHDSVEDTNATLESVIGIAGTTVGSIVDSMTRRGHHTVDQLPGEKWRDWQKRGWEWEETYKEYVIRCCKNPLAIPVKRYDVYDNADPRRHTEGVPVGRYIWTLDYMKGLS